MISTLMLSQMI